MSINRLDDAIRALPEKRTWTITDLAKLREAVGKRADAGETQRFGELLERSWQKFSEPARRALEAIAGKAAPDLKPTVLELEDRYTTKVKEQSALAFVSRELGFLTVDDESSIVWRIPFPDGESKKVRGEPLRDHDKLMHGLESVAWDDQERSVLAVSEDTREVFELQIGKSGGELALEKPVKLGKLEDVSQEKNKGWEGITIWPAEHTGDRRARIVAVHEGSPRAIGIFDRESLELEALVELPASMKDDPRDLSDITFDRRSGRFFVVSDDSRCIWELELRRTAELLGSGPPLVDWSIVPIHRTKLPKNLQAEGIAIDHRGDVWVACEGDETLLRYRRAD